MKGIYKETERQTDRQTDILNHALDIFSLQHTKTQAGHRVEQQQQQQLANSMGCCKSKSKRGRY
jgi:hypothetical protein